MGLCNTMEKKTLDRVFGQTLWSQPTGTYLALSTAAPTDTLNGFSEPTIGLYNYSRQLLRSSGTIDWATPTMKDNVAGTFETHNINDFSFGRAEGDWGIITHFVVFNHITNSTESDALVWGALEVSKDVKLGDLVTFNSGSLVVHVG